MSVFSNNLETIREEMGLNYEEFANKLNINRTTLWRYMKDQRQPDISFAVNVSTTFGINLDWLLGTPFAPNDKYHNPKLTEKSTNKDFNKEEWTEDELLEIELYKKLLLEKRKLKGC